MIIPPPSGIVASSRAGYRRWQRRSSARRSSATPEWSEPRCNQVEARQQAADADQNATNLIDDDRDQKSEGADAARDLLDLGGVPIRELFGAIVISAGERYVTVIRDSSLLSRSGAGTSGSLYRSKHELISDGWHVGAQKPHSRQVVRLGGNRKGAPAVVQ